MVNSISTTSMLDLTVGAYGLGVTSELQGPRKSDGQSPTCSGYATRSQQRGGGPGDVVEERALL